MNKLEQVNLELTNVCNFNCTFCPNSAMKRRRGFMEKGLAFKVLDEIAKYDICEHVCLFIMGEPLLHPDLLEICDYAKKKNLKLKINTNCSITDPNIWKKLFELNVDVIQISISPVEDEFNSTRLAKFSFKDYVSNIKSIFDMHLSIPQSRSKLIVAVISDSGNIESNAQAAIKLLGLQERFRFKFHGFMDKFLLKKGLRLRVFSITENIDLIFGVLHNWGNSLETDKKIRLANFGSCNALRDQIGVFCDGDYTLCCRDYDGFLKIGFNAKNVSIREVLDSKRVKDLISNFRSGKLCFDYCKICRGGSTVGEWLFNQLYSLIYYNIPSYKGLRKALIYKKSKS